MSSPEECFLQLILLSIEGLSSTPTDTLQPRNYIIPVPVDHLSVCLVALLAAWHASEIGTNACICIRFFV